MKKLFTLLTLLVFLGGGKSWGQTEIVLFDGTDAEASAPATSVQTDATTGFSYQLNGFKTSLVDVSSFTGTAISAGDYQKGLRYNGGTTSSNNKATITIPEDYIASIDVVYAHNQSSGSYYFGFGTSDGYSKPSGSNCTWNGTASAASTLYKGTISNVASGTYIMGGSADKCLIAYLKVTLTATKTATSEALKASAAVKVDDTALTLNASTNGYSVSGNTITLSDNITATSTPDNVELVKTITYDDASTSDADVAVTFDGTVTAGYFIGTATIGLTGSETEYTVKVKKDVTPTLVLSTATGSIELKSYEEATGTAKVTLTGANLANGTFTAPTASGVTVTPATVEITDGTIDQEFTITSTATTAAETVLAFAYTGATTQNYTLNYSKTAQRSVSQSTISAATTWDWTDAGDNIIELSGSTSPTNEEEFVMANIAEVENDAEFNSQALKVVCQFPTRGSNHYFQGNSVKFTTSVAGVVKVWFSNTSNREDTGKNRRYLYINGSNTGVYTLNQTFTTASLYVPAGEVVINAYTGEGTPAATMVRIQKIQFDDAALVDADEVTVTSAGYATFVLTQDAYFDATDGVTAYAAKANGETIKLTEVKAAPASTPLVIKAAAGTYTLKKATSISPAAVSTDINDLEAGPVTGDGKSHYVLGKEGSTVGFGLLASSVVLPATKAYIPKSKFDGGEARAFYEIDIDGISTGINMVNGEGLKVNGSETYYDLSGRRVLHPTKGLYIVNGKKVVIK